MAEIFDNEQPFAGYIGVGGTLTVITKPGIVIIYESLMNRLMLVCGLFLLGPAILWMAADNPDFTHSPLPILIPSAILMGFATVFAIKLFIQKILKNPVIRVTPAGIALCRRSEVVQEIPKEKLRAIARHSVLYNGELTKTENYVLVAQLTDGSEVALCATDNLRHAESAHTATVSILQVSAQS